MPQKYRRLQRRRYFLSACFFADAAIPQERDAVKYDVGENEEDVGTEQQYTGEIGAWTVAFYPDSGENRIVEFAFKKIE